ncbi:hypothetical protein [Dyella sp. C11]|uniref:hypothetical protein n=1 Tax=Dyella sp. C11 TaxID=2126991 RepID=UPI000D654462|nr:hypothetical protein [Dyella sp. C11]
MDAPVVGFTGGYWDKPGPGELLKVGFDGNGYIDRDTITAYLMYHCAELAQQRHKPYFRMYESLPDAIHDNAVSELAVGRVFGKLDDWVYLLFDDQHQPGDQDTATVLATYRTKVTKKPEAHQ